jgi:nickel-dependent lactate racemase
MEIPLKYGKSSRQLHIPESTTEVFLLEAARFPPDSDEAALVRSALATPIDSPVLFDCVSPGQRIVIVTNDITRPCPSARLLPQLLHELGKGGVQDDDITIVFGLGTHRPHTPEERARLAGDKVYRRVRCIDSDPADVGLVGHTSRGTPVSIFRPVLEADVRVCLGAIEYHYFVGYSGGYKAIVPGASGIDTIQHNHLMMTAPGAVGGKRSGNPAREDIDEAGGMVGADFVLNVILDGSKRVVSAVAGHPLAAHKEGCAQLDGFGRATLEQPVDVVIVSAGGYPKDINLYQAQKALDSARHVVQLGGIIVLVAECGEGLGNRTFEAWMTECSSPDDIIARIRREFVLGGHKAAAVAMAMRQADIYLVSALPHDYVRSIGFYPFENPDVAVRCALAEVGGPATLAVMPDGSSVLADLKHG